MLLAERRTGKVIKRILGGDRLTLDDAIRLCADWEDLRNDGTFGVNLSKYYYDDVDLYTDNIAYIDDDGNGITEDEMRYTYDTYIVTDAEYTGCSYAEYIACCTRGNGTLVEVH